MKKESGKSGGAESGLQAGLSERGGFDATAQGSKVNESQIPKKRDTENAGKFTIK